MKAIRSALVIAGGMPPSETLLRETAQNAACIVAADSGADAAYKANIRLDFLVGDMDSVSPAVLQAYEERGVRLWRHPARKDATDTALAMECVHEQGITRVFLLGAGGGREDHLLANWMILLHEARRGMHVEMIDEGYTTQVVCGKQFFKGRTGKRLSLFPLGGSAYIRDTDGLSYPMHEQWMEDDNPYGISNVFTQEEAMVWIEQGWLLAIQEK